MIDDTDNVDPFATVQPEVKALRDTVVPDVIPPTLAERLMQVVEQQYGVKIDRSPPTAREIRRSCQFCYGRGCLNCDTLVEREYRRQFPDGPRIIAAFKANDHEDVDLAKTLLTGVAAATTPAEAMRTLLKNCAAIRTAQEHLAICDREEV